MSESRKLRLRHPQAPERDVLSAAVEALRLHRRVVWAARMNTGGGVVMRPDGTKRFLTWGFKGCPDILGQLTDGRLLAIECKTKSGRLRPEQEAFLAQAAARNAVAGVVRGDPAEAVAIVEQAFDRRETA